LEKAGCRLLTVHGRTAKQAYTGVANLEPIYKLQEELEIPVIAN
jgi:tRNA-dihydrouridine synthase